MSAHRINRRDPQAITNRTVGSAAPALDHDVVLAAEIDDVPDNQKITAKPEFRDKGKFFFKLMLHFWADRGVALLRAEPHDGAQK